MEAVAAQWVPAAEHHPRAYCLLRACVGSSKLGILAALTIFFIAPAVESDLLLRISALFWLLTIGTYVSSLAILAVFYLRYSLQTLVGTFLLVNALIVCTLSANVIVTATGVTMLIAIAAGFLIQLHSLDPGWGTDAGNSDITYLWRKLKALPHPGVWLLAGVVYVWGEQELIFGTRVETLPTFIGLALLPLGFGILLYRLTRVMDQNSKVADRAFP